MPCKESRKEAYLLRFLASGLMVSRMLNIYGEMRCHDEYSVNVAATSSLVKRTLMNAGVNM